MGLLTVREAVRVAVVVGVCHNGRLDVPEAVDRVPDLYDGAGGRQQPLVGEGVDHLQPPPELRDAPLCAGERGPLMRMRGVCKANGYAPRAAGGR